MKMQLYPSAVQKEALDKIFHALHIAYNITFHEVFQKNPMVCTTPDGEGNVWPDFKKMATKEWKDRLKKYNSAVGDAPAAALTTNNGLFHLDAKRAWMTGMHNRPVNKSNRKDFHFYNKGNPRRSFLVQLENYRLEPSPENAKVAWVSLPKIDGRIKARGFNRKLWFGENGEHTYAQAVEHQELAERLTVRVSKDNCDSYYISVTFSEGADRSLYLESPVAQNAVPIGVDVGVKDIAILSTGQKIENKHFKQQQKPRLSRMNRKLSRRWGPANPGFRDYNRETRKENKERPEEEQTPVAQPSRRYLKTKRNGALLERRIARQRDTYYHQQTAALVRQTSLIAVETLRVKNMLRNHKLAYALSDAAMSDFLGKLKYKAERRKITIWPIGMFEPSSQRCSVCGEVNSDLKDLSIREWICPKCGAAHDRDINAAKNILAIAIARGALDKGAAVPDDPGTDSQPHHRPQLAKGAAKEDDSPPASAAKPPTKPRRKNQPFLADEPEVEIIFSKEHSSPYNPRYVLINNKTKQIIDDAQGAGYRSISNAKNCYKAKKKWAAKAQ